MQRRSGRRGKPRLTRMDAAVDHMSQYGFEERLVKTIVKQLLREYGGDQGWSFIEEDAYILLIETILDDMKAQEQGNAVGETPQQDPGPSASSPHEPENTSHETETASKASNGEPENAEEVDLNNSSNSAAEPSCSKILNSSPPIITGDAFKDSVQDRSFVSTGKPDDAVNNRNGKESKARELAADNTVHESGDDDPKETEAVHQVSNPTIRRHVSFSLLRKTVNQPTVRGGWIEEEDDDEGSPHSTSLLPSVEKPKTSRKRFPCYGWIEEDEDSPAVEFVYSKPACGSFGPEAVGNKLLRSEFGGRRRKKSRWDETPDSSY